MKGVGCIAKAQGIQSAEPAFSVESLILIFTFGLPAKYVIGDVSIPDGLPSGTAFLRNVIEGDGLAEESDRGIGGCRQYGVIVVNVHRIESDISDIDCPAAVAVRGFGCRILLTVSERKCPVVLAVFKTDQRSLGTRELDMGNGDRLVHEREQGEFDIQRGEAEQIFVGDGFRTTDMDILGVDMRPWNPAAPTGFIFRGRPGQLEVAFDSEGPVNGCRDALVDRGLEPVPVECHDDDD